MIIDLKCGSSWVIIVSGSTVVSNIIDLVPTVGLGTQLGEGIFWTILFESQLNNSFSPCFNLLMVPESLQLPFLCLGKSNWHCIHWISRFSYGLARTNLMIIGCRSRLDFEQWFPCQIILHDRLIHANHL
jgi:hypothetical protein